LLELMVALALVATLFTAFAPNFQSMLEGLQMRAASADLVAAIHETRMQALGRGVKVTLMPVDGDWAQGWQIFIDANGNRRLDLGEALLSTHVALAPGFQSRFRFTDGTIPPYISYNAAGRSSRGGSSAAANWGTLSLQLGEQQRNIMINMLGRVRMCDPVREAASCSGVAE
jgi:type IV fimbrial biogenesis protein FimT